MAHMVLKRIDPMSYAKISAVIAALITFVFCIIYAFFMFALASAFGSDAGAFGAVAGIGIIIFGPIIYAIFAFLIGLLSAWLYNVVAARIGGVEFEFEE